MNDRLPFAPLSRGTAVRSVVAAVPLAAGASAACWWLGRAVGKDPSLAFLKWADAGTVTINVIAMLAFFTAILELWTRSRRIGREAEAFRHPMLWQDERTLITKDNVHEIFQRLRDLPAEARMSRLGQAVDLCATKYQVSTNVGEVAAAADMFVQNEAERAETSYSFARYLAWAIPSIGFIGTVMGLSTALGLFGAEDPPPRPATAVAATSPADVNPADAPKRDLMGEVSGALMLAFNTTFVALVLAILLMFCYHRVVETEEELMARIRDHLLRHFVARAYYPPGRS